MGWQNDWRMRFDQELNLAQAARARGNEGMARVCARRAAGIVAGEYLHRNRTEDPGPSAYDRLRFLLQLPGISRPAQDAIEKLLMRVTVEHNLPDQTDLVGEALRLEAELLGDQNET